MSPILIFQGSCCLSNINITKPLFMHSARLNAFLHRLHRRSPYAMNFLLVSRRLSYLSTFSILYGTARHRDLVNFLTPRRKPAEKRKLNPASTRFIFKHSLIKFSVLNARCAYNINRGIMQNSKACSLRSEKYVNVDRNL